MLNPQVGPSAKRNASNPLLARGSSELAYAGVLLPSNSRQKLAEYIEGAKSQLLIYDGKLTDTRMVRLLEAKARAGVEVRVLGTHSGLTHLVSMWPRTRRYAAYSLRSRQNGNNVVVADPVTDDPET